MDTPPPVPGPSSPQVPVQQVVVPPPKSGCGCFAGGCLSVLVFCFVGLLALVVSGWFICMGMLKKFTSDQPVDVAITMPSDAEYAAARAKADQFRDAVHHDQAATITFT